MHSIVVQGVPIRIELGPRDLKKGNFVMVRRDNGDKIEAPLSDAAAQCQKVLEDIQTSLYNK